MSILDSISVFGLNKLGLELALQCALTVEEWFPGCCNFALECGIDSVHSYQFKFGGFHPSRMRRLRATWKRTSKCCECKEDAIAGKTRCEKHWQMAFERRQRYWARHNRKQFKRTERKLNGIQSFV